MIFIELLFIIVNNEHFIIVSTYGFRNDHARTKIFFNQKHALKYMKLFCRCRVRGFRRKREREGS